MRTKTIGYCCTPEILISDLALLIKRINDQTISNNIAKQVFTAMWNQEGDADTIIEKKGLYRFVKTFDKSHPCP